MKYLMKTILFSAFFLWGCSHYYYIANIQNVPLLREKNDSRLSGAFAFGDESKCIEVQGAYALTDKVGLLADFMSAWGGDVSDKDYGKGIYFDGALGYFKPVKKSGVFEIYGGLGGSSQHHEYSGLHYDSGSGGFYNAYDGNSDLSFLKFFVQPSFGLKFSIFEVAVSTRFSGLSYFSVNNHVYGNSYLSDDLTSISEKGHFFLEPAATLRMGWENINIQVQGLYSGYLNRHESDIAEEAHLSVGLYIVFPAKSQ
jgi:hypothetical protein